MRKIILAIALMMAPLGASAQAINVSVNGLVCAFCAKAIEKTFAKEGVKNVDVNLEERYVKFTLPEGKELSDEQITQTIEDAGYNVVGIERGE